MLLTVAHMAASINCGSFRASSGHPLGLIQGGLNVILTAYAGFPSSPAFGVGDNHIYSYSNFLTSTVMRPPKRHNKNTVRIQQEYAYVLVRAFSAP